MTDLRLFFIALFPAFIYIEFFMINLFSMHILWAVLLCSYLIGTSVLLSTKHHSNKGLLMAALFEIYLIVINYPFEYFLEYFIVIFYIGWNAMIFYFNKILLDIKR